MIVYGRYKNVRDSAWQCLIDFGITSLPINLLKIAKQAGIKVIKNSTVNELSGCESGACILRGDTWYLVYDDECTIGRRRFTIAHELGHIFLGHEIIDGYHGRNIATDKPQGETEADMFASRLLTPACVLWGLNLHTPEEIAEVCGISLTSARHRADRMKILYERQKFLTSPLERKVFEQFKDFINKNRPQN